MASNGLGLGWRRGYAPLAGLSTFFNATDFQMLSGASNVDSLYINDPTMGVAGPSFGLRAMEFNQGAAIQRVVSRESSFFSATPSGFHTISVVYLPALVHDMVLWAWVPAKNMTLVRMTFKLSLQYRDRGDGLRWQFVIDRLTGDGSEGFYLSSSPAIAITAPGWYHIVTSLPYSSSSFFVNLYVNGELNSWGGAGTDLFAAGGAPAGSLALYRSLADDDQYDGILGQTEGARRFVGRIAYFGYRFGSISVNDSAFGEFTQEMANKVYWTNSTLSSPLERTARPAMPPPYRTNTLANRRALRMGL